MAHMQVSSDTQQHYHNEKNNGKMQSRRREKTFNPATGSYEEAEAKTHVAPTTTTTNTTTTLATATTITPHNITADGVSTVSVGYTEEENRTKYEHQFPTTIETPAATTFALFSDPNRFSSDSIFNTQHYIQDKLQGRLWLDVDRNGKRGSEMDTKLNAAEWDTGIGGVEVQLVKCETNEPVYTTTSLPADVGPGEGSSRLITEVSDAGMYKFPLQALVAGRYYFMYRSPHKYRLNSNVLPLKQGIASISDTYAPCIPGGGEGLGYLKKVREGGDLDLGGYCARSVGCFEVGKEFNLPTNEYSQNQIFHQIFSGLNKVALPSESMLNVGLAKEDWPLSTYQFADVNIYLKFPASLSGEALDSAVPKDFGKSAIKMRLEEVIGSKIVRELGGFQLQGVDVNAASSSSPKDDEEVRRRGFLRRSIQEEGDTSITYSLTVRGSYRPPPHQQLGSIMQDSINRDPEGLAKSLNKGDLPPVFEELKEITARHLTVQETILGTQEHERALEKGEIAALAICSVFAVIIAGFLFYKGLKAIKTSSVEENEQWDQSESSLDDMSASVTEESAEVVEVEHKTELGRETAHNHSFDPRISDGSPDSERTGLEHPSPARSGSKFMRLIELKTGNYAKKQKVHQIISSREESRVGGAQLHSTILEQSASAVSSGSKEPALNSFEGRVKAKLAQQKVYPDGNGHTVHLFSSSSTKQHINDYDDHIAAKTKSVHKHDASVRTSKIKSQPKSNLFNERSQTKPSHHEYGRSSGSGTRCQRQRQPVPDTFEKRLHAKLTAQPAHPDNGRSALHARVLSSSTAKRRINDYNAHIQNASHKSIPEYEEHTAVAAQQGRGNEEEEASEEVICAKYEGQFSAETEIFSDPNLYPPHSTAINNGHGVQNAFGGQFQFVECETNEPVYNTTSLPNACIGEGSSVLITEVPGDGLYNYPSEALDDRRCNYLYHESHNYQVCENVLPLQGGEVSENAVYLECIPGYGVNYVTYAKPAYPSVRYHMDGSTYQNQCQPVQLDTFEGRIKAKLSQQAHPDRSGPTRQIPTSSVKRHLNDYNARISAKTKSESHPKSDTFNQRSHMKPVHRSGRSRATKNRYQKCQPVSNTFEGRLKSKLSHQAQS